MLLAFLNELVLIEANVELVTELFAAETFFFSPGKNAIFFSKMFIFTTKFHTIFSNLQIYLLIIYIQ